MMDESYEIGAGVEVDHAKIEVDLTSISSVALARLIEEVRNNEPTASHAYDRSHNRHNR